MGTKGTKASNIYQVLKGSGAWQSKDSQGPMIKGVGIKSPLNMKGKPSPVKNSVDEQGRHHPLTAEQSAADADKNRVSLDAPKTKRTKKTSYSDAYKKRDMKTYGKLSEAEYTAEAKRQNKSYKETGKWDAPKKPMETKSESQKVVTTNNNKNTGEDKKVTTGEDKKVTKTDTAKKNLETAKESVKDARSEVKDTNKAKRIQKRADKKAKKAKRIKEKGGTRVGNALRGIKNVFKKKDKKKDDSAAKMKKSPIKMDAKFNTTQYADKKAKKTAGKKNVKNKTVGTKEGRAKGKAIIAKVKKEGEAKVSAAAKKSPAKKALVGKQNNLPEDLKAKIKASPAKKYKK